MVKDFYIKNMVCDRCIKVLKDELNANSIEVLNIELGRLRLDIKNNHFQILEKLLENNGFLLITSAEQKLTEQVKLELIKLLQELPLKLDKKLSEYLSDGLGHEYSKISKVFSFTEGITIEKYFIKLKIEKVKELVQDKELNFTEISQLLDYSHINHLSGQFKSETGMSLSTYKSQQKNFRNSLDKII
ncbi:helix-turn-helix domain-containing protein [Zobellia galactanivorans]|uniref:helix-turn-helix domain-containing protein n=1 Tax=Zobellia galactanivorans (strain DSM 12802 / CCUG 47099 / CIP 106680 / NCIMB 13871 / Dsij) TaxID=63186 RepID=UPI001C07DC7D|nr:AraC family transcriptional regulator [Zobellia galactanivorans]MBU3026077.1 AraC family transcriptional regulator [Zobellia galactanivorans]